MDILFLVGRLMFGGFFIMMGMNHFMKHAFLTGWAQSKGVPMAGLAVYGAGLLLLFGGFTMAAGVLVDFGVIALIAFFVPISFKMHNFWAIDDPQEKMTQQVNFFKNMAYIGAALMTLAISEPWTLSLF